MSSKILLVEDNQDISEIISMNLAMLDHQIETYNDGVQAYKHLHNVFDLAILDIMLPGTDGLKLCKRLRQLQPDIPIILLTAKSTERDIVTGLESGADDYMCKPFSVLELQARVKAHLRRTQLQTQVKSQEQAVLEFNGLQINPNLYQVRLNGTTLDTTVKEFELLYFLARQPKRVFTREQLLDEIWGMRHQGSAHTVNSTMNRLRAKIETDPANPVWLKTVWGVGYKFAQG